MIDAIAAESVVFDDAVASMGTSYPSHATLFTGLNPGRHGVRWNGDALQPEFLTLAEMLSAAGYDTAAFVSMEAMVTRGGLGQGFTEATGESVLPENGLLPGEDVNERAIQWLQRARQPFFSWLQFSEAHSPYRLGPYAEEVFEREGYDGPLAEGASTKTFYSLGSEIPWTETERMALRSLYDGEVRRLDRLVGDFVEALRASNLLQNTILIITSDHGQALGEHDVVGHGFLLWQSVLRVPLIIRDPAQGRPHRIATRVGLVDLVPTLLDRLGLPGQEGLDGRSLAGAMAGERLPDALYFSEARELADNRRSSADDAAAIAVFSGRLKAIWRPSGMMVFDLERDPGELGGAHSPVPAAERAALEAAVATYRERARYAGPPTDLTEEAVRELRALGYVQ